MAYVKKVTKSKFDAVKILIEGGASTKEIAKYLDLSDNTIYVIKGCEKFEDYEQYLAEKMAKANAARAVKMRESEKDKTEQPVEKSAEQPAPVAQQPAEAPVKVIEHRQTVMVQATHYMMEELKQQNELLKLISNKLSFIVDQLS